MRYLPLTEDDRKAMLSRIGARSVDDLFQDVPKAARLDGPVDLPAHQPEFAVERALRRMAERNRAAGNGPFFVGCGAYRHHVPATVDHLIQRSEFLTTFTPNQPEIAQGTLQSLFEFQTQVALLTGMEVANASMYDGSTACAEAALMARRVTKRTKIVLSGGLHPHYESVVRTLAGDDSIVTAKPDPQGRGHVLDMVDDDTACVVVQTPDVFGNLRNLDRYAEAAHKVGALLVAVTTEAVSFGAVTPPGAMGADIVAAEGQSFGNPLIFGGPYVGLFATREKLVRQMPGRVAGETTDADGARGYVLTLSTREQHIRRDKATSNICTNSGLCALGFTAHMSLLGEAGLRRLAALNHAAAVRTAEAVCAIDGVSLLTDTFFNEFSVHLARSATEVVEKLVKKGVLAGVPAARLWPSEPDLDGVLIIAATELTADDDITALASGLEEALS